MTFVKQWCLFVFAIPVIEFMFGRVVGACTRGGGALGLRIDVDCARWKINSP